jgi:hypothetical protein
MNVVIRRVSLLSLGKFGCVLGVVVAFLPGLVCGLVGLGSTHLLRNWLEDWQDLTITLLGQEVARLDLVQLLGLTDVLESLWILDAASVPLIALTILGLALVLGALLAIIIVMGGLTYNLLASATGGLVVDMAAVPGKEVPEPEVASPPSDP